MSDTFRDLSTAAGRFLNSRKALKDAKFKRSICRDPSEFLHEVHSVKELPIGTARSINGRNLSLRRYYSQSIEWFDNDTKEIVRTPLKFKADRKSHSQWKTTTTSQRISEKARKQIERLARQCGLNKRQTQSLVKEQIREQVSSGRDCFAT